MKDEARAVEEIARTAGKGIDAARELGSFIAQFIRGPLEQASGMVEDRLKYMRWERQQRMIQRSKEFLKQLGLDAPTRAVPMKIALPILQAASMEDDDSLQDIWVRLLVNAGDAGREVEITRMHISILEDLSSLDVRILNTIYSHVGDQIWRGIWTHELPDRIAERGPQGDDNHPSPEIQLALGNLVRVGCLSPASTYGGRESLSFVYPTVLGQSLYKACTLRRSQG